MVWKHFLPLRRLPFHFVDCSLAVQKVLFDVAHMLIFAFIALLLVFLFLSVVCPAQPTKLNLKPSFFLNIFPKFQYVLFLLLSSSRHFKFLL